MTELTSAAPPGWYRDPGGTADQRYWDGHQWTLGVVTNGSVTEKPLPAEPPVADRRIALPAAAAAWALLAFVVGVGLSATGVLVARSATDDVAILSAASIVLLWVALLGAVVIHSRRFGTGKIRHDYQLCLRGVDAALGLGLSLAARMAAGAVALIVLVLTNADLDAVPSQLDAVDESTTGLIVVLVLAVFGAPFVEELFFRGLLMRSLEPALRPAGAIAVQAILFGLVHVGSVGWKYNLAIVASLTVAGVALGVTAYVSKRLGPSIWLHAFFNAFAAIVMIAQHAAAVTAS